jgi:hypothetical protein
VINDDRGVPAVALVTCAEVPELADDDRLLQVALGSTGVRADPVVWDASGVDWASYDLAVLRSPWDYPRRRDAFVAWACRVPRLANPAAVVAWNTDKRYLAELATAGVPVVPTDWVGPAHPYVLPDHGEWVIKPAVGAGSIDTGRYDLRQPEHRALAAAHVSRLQASARLVMVQPYQAAVDTAGETSLLFLGAEYSHAVRKGPMLAGPDDGATGLYRKEEITLRKPTPAEFAVASAALAAVPGGPLLYARVDLIPGPDGQPLLVELELTEPSLFLGYSPGAAERLAAAILSQLRLSRRT